MHQRAKDVAYLNMWPKIKIKKYKNVQKNDKFRYDGSI